MFEFNSSLFFWTLVNFLILLVLVHKFALPALLKMARESEEKREAALRQIEENNRESQKILEEYRERMKNAEAEVRQILAQAQKEREEIKKTETEKMLKEKHDLLQGIRNEIDVEKRRFVAAIKAESVELILSAAKTLIQRELKAQDHEQIIEKNIQEFDALVER